MEIPHPQRRKDDEDSDSSGTPGGMFNFIPLPKSPDRPATPSGASPRLLTHTPTPPSVPFNPDTEPMGPGP